MHFKCSAVEFGGGSSILSPLWISEEREAKRNASLSSSSDISNSHMFVLKIILKFFFPSLKTLASEKQQSLFMA